MNALIRSEAEARFPFKLSGGGVDYKAWAKRFVFRFERGDKTLLPVQVQFAYLALDLDPPKV
jgi:hypothetical protein